MRSRKDRELEEQGSARPKAFVAAVRRMSDMGVLSIEVFVNTTIVMPSSRAMTMDVTSSTPRCASVVCKDLLTGHCVTYASNGGTRDSHSLRLSYHGLDKIAFPFEFVNLGRKFCTGVRARSVEGLTGWRSNFSKA